MVRFKIFCIGVGTMVMLSISPPVNAVTDLGTVGEVYPVAESDIRDRLRAQAAKTWETEQKKYHEKAQNYQSPDLYPLPRAKEERAYYVDMAYTLDRDLKDKDGNVMYPKGYTFNPLDYANLHLGLVVIDASDSAQVRWFKNSPYKNNKRVKLLLSGGYAQGLIEELNRAVFYLDKTVAERFRLSAVPCVVVERGRQMMVTEFLVKEGDRDVE